MSQILTTYIHYDREDETEGVFIKVDRDVFFESVREEVRNLYDDLHYRNENEGDELEENEKIDLISCLLYLDDYNKDDNDFIELVDGKIMKADDKISRTIINHTDTTKQIREQILCLFNSGEQHLDDIMFDLLNDAKDIIFKTLKKTAKKYIDATSYFNNNENEPDEEEEEEPEEEEEQEPEPAQLNNADQINNEEKIKRANIKREETKAINILKKNFIKANEQIKFIDESLHMYKLTWESLMSIYKDSMHDKVINIYNFPNYHFCDVCRKNDTNPQKIQKRKLIKINDDYKLCIKHAVEHNEKEKQKQNYKIERLEEPRGELYEECKKAHNEEYKKYLIEMSTLNDMQNDELTNIIINTSFMFCDMCQTSGDNKLYDVNNLIKCDCKKCYCINCLENLKKIHYEDDGIIKSARCAFCREYLE